MPYQTERNFWSLGNSVDSHDSIHKSMMTTKNAFHKELFPKKEKGDSCDSSDYASEQAQVESTRNITSEELKRISDDALRSSLEKCGYSAELLNDEAFKKCFSSALGRKGSIVSKRTGKVWLERAVPEEPPAFLPDKLQLGDKVQVLNWVPMGVHGATIDLYPKGKVTKIYSVKCLVSKEPMELGTMPDENVEHCEEERVIGLELDGKGPHVSKEGKKHCPYVIKDSSVIVRFPPAGSPSGETQHVHPGIM